MMKRMISLLIVICMMASLMACGKKAGEDGSQEIVIDDSKTHVMLFAASSLHGALDELIATYSKDHPDVQIIPNYDSSGTLKEQIKEGAACDIFFSADERQMDELEEEGYLIEDSRKSVMNNHVCVVTYKGSGTKVTKLMNMDRAESIALADGSVPVGIYTRTAMMNSYMLGEVEDPATITTEHIADALEVEINVCKSASDVVAQLVNGSNEVGTIYKSDLYGHEKELEVIEELPYKWTGAVLYPVAQIVNEEADEVSDAAVKEFLEFLKSDQAKETYKSFYFETIVQ